MNSSLPGLPIVAGQPGSLPAVPAKFEINQSGAESAHSFGGLLGEAHTALSGATPDLSPGVESAPAELQVLPQDGKLLPLLEHALDRLADSGIDPRQFVERLQARLEAMAQNSDLQPAEQLAAALQQLIQEQPTLKTALPGELLAWVADNKAGLATSYPDTIASGLRQAGFTANGGVADSGQASTLAAGRQPHPDHPPQPALTGAVKPLVPDTLLSQLQPQATAPQAHQGELSVLTAALKRLTTDNRATPADATYRPDSITTATPVSSTTVGPASAGASGAPTASVNTPFGQAGWDQALGERIQWLAGQKVQAAQVKLNPANLGPLEVRIQVNNDQASVHFTAQHAVVREALEAALPRLRDMFEASGVALVDVDVSSGESFGGQQAMQDSSKSHRIPDHDEDEAVLETRLDTPLRAVSAQGYLDLFA